jgi:hypothetical protein
MAGGQQHRCSSSSSSSTSMNLWLCIMHLVWGSLSSLTALLLQLMCPPGKQHWAPWRIRGMTLEGSWGGWLAWGGGEGTEQWG